jgi:DNA primase
MTIQEIKSRLSIAQVLSHYNLKADKNGRMLCPFHNDKTPSMQIYTATNSWTCFSSNCNAGSGDQIEFIKLYEKLSKHEAIMKAKLLAGHTSAMKSEKKESEIIPQQQRIQLLTKAWGFYVNAMKQTKAAQEYVKSRNIEKMEIGFNSGRFHYRSGISESEIKSLITLGMISPIDGSEKYRSFAKDCIMFPLRDNSGNIVSIYGRSITNNENQRHYYLKDRQGLYPEYPKAEAEILILTESIIDAATLLRHYKSEKTNVLACYGTNGLNEEHIAAMKALSNLKEVILFFDGDQAGLMAAEKYSKELHELLQVSVSIVSTPENEDINSLAQGHSSEIFIHLIENRKRIFSFSSEKPVEIKNPELVTNTTAVETGILDAENPDCIIYETDALVISIWGGIELNNLGRLKISVHVRSKADRYKTYRDEVNLYSHSSAERLIRNIAAKLELSTTYISKVIADLTEQLEQYRNQERIKAKQKEIEAASRDQETFTDAELQAGLKFLQGENLMQRTKEAISKIGLVGEEKNGLLLFFILLTRLFKDPLHALVQGKSGSGKTHLLKKTCSLIPKAHIETVTALSENTLYHSGKDYWKHKILLIEDLDGAYNALLPLREFMSNQSIRKLSTSSDPKTGEHQQKWLYAEGPVCVAGATTKDKIYEDNANRSFLLHVNESAEHIQKVLDYQRKSLSGLLDRSSEEKIQTLFKAAQLQLMPIEIKIPFGEALRIPDYVFKKLRTNTHYLTLIKAIAFWHQRQREIKQTKEGNYFIDATLEDVCWANELSKEVLLRKSDELSGSLRSFFESVKNYLRENKDESFYAKPIREKLRMNPMQANRYLSELEQRGYIKQTGGNRKTGFEYSVKVWDDYEQLKKGINILDEVLEKLRANEETRVAKNGKHNSKKIEKAEV